MFITYLSPDIIVYRRTPSYNIIQHRASPDITGQHHASTKIIVYHRHRRAHLLYTTGHHRTLPDTIVARTFNVNNHISLHFVVHHRTWAKNKNIGRTQCILILIDQYG